MVGCRVSTPFQGALASFVFGARTPLHNQSPLNPRPAILASPGCVKKPWGCDAASTALVLAVPSDKIAGICFVIPGEAPGGFLRAQVRHDGADFRWLWPPA